MKEGWWCEIESNGVYLTKISGLAMDCILFTASFCVLLFFSIQNQTATWMENKKKKKIKKIMYYLNVIFGKFVHWFVLIKALNYNY